MEEKKVQISNGKEVIVKEILYKQVVEIQNNENKSDGVKNLLKLSTGITDEEWETLSMRDGVKLQNVVNEVNGLTQDFLQKTPLKDNTSAI